MTDKVDNQQVPISATEDSPASEQTTVIDLEYPHLLLQTSLESLLTCSYQSTSSDQTVRMVTSTFRQPSLDESWASLDIGDFSQDDELHSESASNVSLLDVPSTEDEESVIEEDVQSDVNHVDEPVHVTKENETHLSNIIDHVQPVNTEEEIYSENDTIILRPAAYRPHPESTLLSLKRQCNIPLQENCGVADGYIWYETIEMLVSSFKLENGPQPFHVGYYGTLSARINQSEVLGKIGSALIATRCTDSSSTFHITPSEFDADLKPQSAELVPSDAQMFVEDITVVTPQQQNSTDRNIDIAFRYGAVIRSRRADAQSRPPGTIWRPDLLIAHINTDDAEDNIRDVQDILTMAKRHHIPLLQVSDGRLGQPVIVEDYNLLSTILQAENAETESRSDVERRAIDLQSFLRLDSEQLNRHIQFLTERSQAATTKCNGFYPMEASFVRKLYAASGLLTDPNMVRWVQEEMTNESKPTPPHPRSEKSGVSRSQLISRINSTFQSWPTLVSLTISLSMGWLFIFILTLFYSRVSVKTIDSAPRIVCDSISSKSPTAIAAVSTKSCSDVQTVTSTTKTDLVQSDLFAYILGPKSVQRFVGDVFVIKEPKPESPVKKSPPKVVSEVEPVLSRVQQAIDKVTEDVQLRLGQAQNKLKDQAFLSATQVWDKHRNSMDKLQREVKLTFDLVSDNVQSLSRKSRKSLLKLADQNQALLARSRRATEEQLFEIMKEHKDIMISAQRHARKLLQKARKPKQARKCRKN